MDAKLLAWARRVKPGMPPAIWLFTDPTRLPDPLAAIARLPRGRAGIVLRPALPPFPAGFLAALMRLCRERRLALSVAGDWRLAWRLHAGLHLRGGRAPAGAPRALAPLTGSAHDAAEVVRCRRAGARLIFISPVFATASHPGTRGLGVTRWAALARLAGPRAAALGGIDGRRLAGLPRACRAVGAIGALR